MHLSMIFVLVAMVVALIALVVVTLTRHASRSEEARREVDVEVGRIRAADARIGEEFIAALDNGRNVEQALPEAHRAWQQLLPRGKAGGEPSDWTDDDLEDHAAAESARRQERISRKSLLRGGLSALAVVFLGMTVLLVLWGTDSPRSAGGPIEDPPTWGDEEDDHVDKMDETPDVAPEKEEK